MTGQYSGGGRPDRTLALLWRHAEATTPGGPQPTRRDTTANSGARRGPRPGLTVDAVVDSAITVADAEGLEAATMRRVAETLGVAPMTIYTYVPGKAELLDLMLDTLYARMPRTDSTGQPWQDRVAAVAEENLALFRAHPWAATVTTGRPPLGPGLLAKYEHELRAFDDTDLDDVVRDAALTYLLDFVRAAVRTATEVLTARRDSGQSESEWWEANAPLLNQVVDERRYPTAVRVGSAAGAAHNAAYDPEHAYRFGLARVLDGLGVLVAAASAR